MNLESCFYGLNKALYDINEEKKFEDWEGHIEQTPYCINFLLETLAIFKKKNILQIGFNAGHSTLAMLFNFPDLQITSVDLGKSYIDIGSDLVDHLFPNKHKLIIGNSLEVLPTLTGAYDFFFIDGGHQYEEAKADLDNCWKLGKDGDIILIDDIIYLIDCTKVSTESIGPTKAYSDFLKEKKAMHYAHTEVLNRGMSVCVIKKN